MSNLTLNMALAQNARTAPRDEAQQDTPMTDSPMAPTTPIDDSNHPPQQKGRDYGDEIPAFAHLIPGIFVPLTQDLLAPMEPAKDRAERLQQMQKSLDANETAVRDNLAWMFEREARRAVAVARKQYDFSEPYQPETISWEETEKLVNSMSTPAAPEKNYHLSTERLATMNEKAVFAAVGQLCPHEHITRQVLATANNGSIDIEAYSARHIKPIREQLQTSLEGASGV